MAHQTIQELCTKAAKENNWTWINDPSGWIYEFYREDETISFYGHRFSINSSTADHFATDKAASSFFFEKKDVPHIPGTLLMRPQFTQWMDSEGTSGVIATCIEKFNFPLVIKPNKGSTGTDVFICLNRKEIDLACYKIWQKDRDALASPFIKALSEFRFFVHNKKVIFAYQKELPFVLADGTKTYRELINEAGYAKAEEIQYYENIDSVPEKDSEVIVSWKFNLAQGSHPKNIEGLDQEKVLELTLLAKKAASALSINFCSVDIIESTEKELFIMEVNSGIGITKFVDQFPNGQEIAEMMFTQIFK